VGKTFAMLDEGWRRKERGTDVVVGYVETHGRPKTAAQLRDLEVVARQPLEYRGQRFEEMDLDALLARKPQVALVDELAHTNVPGSRNEKRWQDVQELLDAGINVISTVNIQHLESLNDVVETITGVTQRETVPDAVVRAADQIELVDMSPEALRRRMAHGNIYAPEKVDVALGNYFRVGNLTALRELALLWVADRVDESLQDYRERHGIAAAWETKERVVVALTGKPGAENLIRRAARVAMRVKGELVGVHVQASDGLATPSTSELEHHRALLEQLGGRYKEVPATDVAKALVQAAKAENATQLILGASRRSRWTEIIHGSVINGVIREAGRAFDVQVVSEDPGDESDRVTERRPRWRRLAGVSRNRQLIGLALAIVGLPLLTVGLVPARDSLGLQNALLCYLLVVVGIATVGGLWPAILASLIGFMLLNWFFAPPIHQFTISNGRDAFALVTFVLLAAVVSLLVDFAARRQADAYRARVEARALTRMAGLVLRDQDPLPALVDDLAATFRLEGASLLRPTRDGWTVEAASGSDPPRSPVEGTLVLSLPQEASLVLRGTSLRSEDREALGGFATHLGVALEGRRLQAEAATGAALARTNELRTALLAAVSHDLRTPLATIKASATSLLDQAVNWTPEATRDLLETIDEEADRLNNLVGNLLDMSRLQTGALVVNAEPVLLEDVVEAAMASLVGPPKVELELHDAPPVEADPVLLERALANIIDNAAVFSPSGCHVRVAAGAVAGRVDIRVIDQGPGIDVDDRQRVFTPFQRLGDNPGGTGVGLGLAVARGFIDAMGGDIVVEDTPGGGCTVVVTLPAAP
jgi:two-component system sensor histidine kinase KdpD